jgi:hypothetical protein
MCHVWFRFNCTRNKPANAEIQEALQQVTGPLLAFAISALKINDKMSCVFHHWLAYFGILLFVFEGKNFSGSIL